MVPLPFESYFRSVSLPVRASYSGVIRRATSVAAGRHAQIASVALSTTAPETLARRGARKDSVSDIWLVRERDACVIGRRRRGIYGRVAAAPQKNAAIKSRRPLIDSARLIAVRRCDPLSSPFV